MLLWKPENTDPAPSPRPVRPAPLRIASRHRARARAPRAGLCSAQPRCDLRSRRFSVAPRPRPGLPSVAPEMHAAAGLPRGLADRFCRAPERVSSGPTCRGRGSSPGSPVTWSQPAPAPTPWGQSRGARPAPPPPGASASSVSRGISSTKGMDPCNLPLSFWNVPGGGHSYPLSIIPTVCGALNTVWGNPWPPVCLPLHLALSSSPQGSWGVAGVAQTSAQGHCCRASRALDTSLQWRVPVSGWSSEPQPRVRTTWRARKKQV